MEKSPANKSEELSTEERFAQAYEGARISPIPYDELPPEVAEHFEGRSKMYLLPEQYIPRNFSHLYLLEHPDGSQTYIAEQVKSFGEGEKDNFVYFVDYDGDKMAGRGEIINCIETHNKDMIGKPYPGFTRTYGPEDQEGGGRDFRRRGLGKRRIIEMDAYAQARFGYPLHSSHVLIHDDIKTDASAPQRIWERLVEEGKAESYMEGKGKDAQLRFRMKG